jgi:hypothetical protein
MAKLEKTGWRDESYSKWHRLLGRDLPFQDIDYLLIEYDNFMPIALLELKSEHAPILPNNDPQAKTGRNTADKLEVPYFVVHYNKALTRFVARPYNQIGVEKYGTRIMDTKEYVSFLYELRNRPVPEDVLARCELDAATVIDEINGREI